MITTTHLTLESAFINHLLLLSWLNVRLFDAEMPCALFFINKSSLNKKKFWLLSSDVFSDANV